MPCSEKEVLAAFQRAGNRPVKVRDLARELGVRRRDLPALRDLIRKLEAAGKLRRGANRRYQTPSASPDVVVGRLQGARGGFAFILRDNAPDVYVSAENLGLALHGDQVMARLRRHRGRQEAVIERVLEPARKLLSGTLHFDASGWFLVPDEERIGRDVNLTGSVIQPQSRQQGHKALVRLASAGRDAELYGEIVTILGPPDQPGVRTEGLLAEFDLPASFADAVLASVEDLQPPDAIACAGREDLSQLLAFTIDPLDAKDHDDAVSLVRTRDGGFELGVHIADVSAYVEPDSLADQEAEHRGTSVYLADRVVPMLPEILSNHVCSLRPGVPRLALSALLEFDVEGRPRGGRLTESWIVSRVKLSYQAAETLLGGDEPQPAHLATQSGEESGEAPWPGSQPWAAVRPAVQSALTDMRHLARLLRSRRMSAGSLDIDTPEYRVLHDARGRVTSIEERERLESYQIIEEFMLVANQHVARALSAGRQPLLWRVHETPTTAKAEELQRFLKKLGIGWSVGDPPDNADYQRLLAAIDKRAERRYLMYKVLRSLQKARYDGRHRGHFGLAFSHYTHFTSPIRRYPDLYNHRLVRRLLRGHAVLDVDPARHAGDLEALGVHTSARELHAADAERASLKLKVCEFLAERVGESADGFVSAIADHGLYVDVPTWRTEGLVHARALTDDDYRPDPQGTRLVGTRTRRTFRFGQPVRVQLVRADPDRRQIDLMLSS